MGSLRPSGGLGGSPFGLASLAAFFALPTAITDAIFWVLDGNANDDIPPRAAREQVAAGGVERQSTDNQLVASSGQVDRSRVAEQSAIELELVDDLELAAAGIDSPAVGREAQAVKRLIDRHSANDLLPGAVQIDDDDLVVLPARVENGQILPARMNAALTGKLPTSICLPAGRSRH